MTFRNAPLLTLSLMLAVSFGIPAPAQTNSSAQTESSESAGAGDEKPTRVLEGGVKGTVLLLDDGLAHINVARELLQESASKIMKEASRKDTIVVRGPNYIGNGTVIPAVGGDGGVMQFGTLPIRKDKLEKFLAESEQNMAALQNYIDALQIPPEKAEALNTIYGGMRASLQDAQDNFAKLKELSAQKRLANGKIAKAALRIYDAMGQLEKQRAKLYEVANAATP